MTTVGGLYTHRDRERIYAYNDMCMDLLFTVNLRWIPSRRQIRHQQQTCLYSIHPSIHLSFLLCDDWWWWLTTLRSLPNSNCGYSTSTDSLNFIVILSAENVRPVSGTRTATGSNTGTHLLHVSSIYIYIYNYIYIYRVESVDPNAITF